MKMPPRRKLMANTSAKKSCRLVHSPALGVGYRVAPEFVRRYRTGTHHYRDQQGRVHHTRTPVTKQPGTQKTTFRTRNKAPITAPLSSAIGYLLVYQRWSLPHKRRGGGSGDLIGFRRLAHGPMLTLRRVWLCAAGSVTSPGGGGS